MDYRQVGHSELTVSVVSLGCNNFGGASSSTTVAAYGALDRERTRDVVHAALDAGVTLFDTANVYGRGGSERMLGEILAGCRSEVVLATKWGGGEQPGVRWGSREYVVAAVEDSLRRLATDWIDLYQLHWPDPLTDWDETLGALDDLVQAGKVRHVGSSHLAGWEVVDLDWQARCTGRARWVAAQNEYSLLHRAPETDLLPACRHVGVGVLTYFPLASGLLTGKYRRDAPAPDGARMSGRVIDTATYDVLEALTAFATERGHTLLDLAIAAVASRDGVTSVITGATRPEQITANAAAAQWRPSADDLTALAELLDGPAADHSA